MTLKLNQIGRPAIAFNSEGGSGGAGEGGGATTPESILFPSDKPAGDGTGDAGAGDGKGEGEGGNQPAGDWKEFVPDPNKSDEENAAAKAEHDKTKPDDKNKDGPANKVPEDGKYELKMPDGVELDEELAGALGPEFKELNLTNAQAQKLVDKYIATQQARSAKQVEGWANTVNGWVETAKADKEIGGTKWDGTVSDARRAVDTLGTPELKEYLEASGGGNHPEVIRLMAKVGAMIKEDNPATGGAAGAGKPAEPAHVLFPNDAPKR